MHYYSANNYYKKTFGEKIYKISLNGGMTCPNRDGTLGSNGCIFCSNTGSGDFAANAEKTIEKQIDEGIERVKNKISTGKYIGYFQSFTNTYASVDYLRTLFTQAIKHPSIVGLSIATRPDCLGGEVIALLEELQQSKPIIVELGLQTIHPSTAAYIRRGYDLSVFDEGIKKLKDIGVHIVVHTILGLPGETQAMMLETADYVAHSSADGIKLQLLHVLKDTDLAKDYKKHKFAVLTPEAYVDILCACIKRLPPNMVIHRLTGDGPKKLLVAPLWSADKKRVLNTIQQTLRKRSIIQGSGFVCKC